MIDVFCVGGSFLFLVLGWFVGKYLFPCHSFREPRWKTKDGSIVIGEKPHDAKRKTRYPLSAILERKYAMERKRNVSRDVLDGGSVTLVGWLGDSLYPANVARTSTGSKGDPERDARLVRRLHVDRHTSPFEFIQFEFHVRAPIFVIRQWQRHRTASYNERSGRYSIMETEFHIPEEWRSQHDKNRQMSGEPITGPGKVRASEMYSHALEVVASTYRSLLEIGVAREQARAILPLSLYTEMRVSVDAHNLYHFLTLRTAEDAQPEIRVYADAIVDILGSMPEFRDLVEIWGFGEKDT